MGTSLSYKLSTLDNNVKKFITREMFEEILDLTQFEEEEVFLLLKRFILLKPKENSFTISINDLKNINEFKNNPYRELMLNAVNIYQMIYEYLGTPAGRNFPNREIFNISSIIQSQYEFNCKDAFEKEAIDEDDKEKAKVYKCVLVVEEEKNDLNEEFIIDFKLFCQIFNHFSFRKTLDQRFNLSFNIFDINKDGKICIKDLKNFYSILLKNTPLENKYDKIDKLSLNVISEFREDDVGYEIDFNNFQKILWSTNFISNLTIEP
jgi:Ca2+-binding EF-hand superfamily protein